MAGLGCRCDPRAGAALPVATPTGPSAWPAVTAALHPLQGPRQDVLSLSGKERIVQRVPAAHPAGANDWVRVHGVVYDGPVRFQCLNSDGSCPLRYEVVTAPRIYNGVLQSTEGTEIIHWQI